MAKETKEVRDVTKPFPRKKSLFSQMQEEKAEKPSSKRKSLFGMMIEEAEKGRRLRRESIDKDNKEVVHRPRFVVQSQNPDTKEWKDTSWTTNDSRIAFWFAVLRLSPRERMMNTETGKSIYAKDYDLGDRPNPTHKCHSCGCKKVAIGKKAVLCMCGMMLYARSRYKLLMKKRQAMTNIPPENRRNRF